MAPTTESETQAHQAVVREEFTRQAGAYAAAPVITDADRIARLVGAIDPQPADRAIEIATGPGYVAMALAARCREVVGIDLTPAPIAIAERTSRERGLANVRFQVGEASHLPFADGAFDIAVCRFAFHHFEHPAAILAQMRRVCRVGGTVAIEDLFASENPARAAYYNQVERLRDGSHTRALALSELVAMTAEAGLELERIHSDRLTVNTAAWLASAQTPAAKAAEVRRLLDDDLRRDLSGMRPFSDAAGLRFIQRIAALVCRKL
ncbi:MAG: class I SAM-dependent methyltransferase [Candidatus Binataceae bacterium]|nr:class I SAM-dependent methyltransferase [Candidatus Binataceae bacterium]